jgi:phosphatidylserine/phosphatidylglycerophosphate/cardiolipin synthase-like enzyme
MAILAGLFFLFQSQQQADPAEAPAASSASLGQYSLFFTDVGGPSASTLRGGPDQALVEALDAAGYSVDMAIYHLNLWSVRDALIRAHRRGVKVRVVTDSDNVLEAEIQALERAGIPVLGDRRESLMHHKFVVIDRLEVWTGSMNLTVNGAYRNDNNLIRVRSRRLAQDYTREFEEMFLEDRFGAQSRADTPYPRITEDNNLMEVYFSPDDRVAIRIVGLLRGAQRSVRFLAYAFTAEAFATVMLERAQAGVVIQGVIESGQAYTLGSQVWRLQEAGLDIHVDRNPANMHHKVILIDDQTVITGSYNFSRSAEERNDENILILHDPYVVAEYLQEFERIYQSATR